MGRFVAVCTLFLGICLAALPAGAAQRVALVVGNSGYKLISPLANPANDAALMAETLREVGFEVIEAKNADRRGMARAIRDFGKRLRRAEPDAVGLFYYAGHGVQAGGTNYLIPLGARVEDEADLEIEAVSASWVLGQMESAGNALNIVILDACRNNPFKGSFRAATRGLARMNAPSGSLVAYAAAPGQVAADGTADNSPYTAALVATMKEPGLDLDDVFKRVRVAVETATGKQQTPWEESSLKGDFYFIAPESKITGNVQPPPLQAPPAFDTRALELAFWNSIEKSADPADFEDYLARYPDGAFSGLSKRRLAALTKVAVLPSPPPAPAPPAGLTVSEQAPQTKVANLPPSQAALTENALREIDSYVVAKKKEFKEALEIYFRKNNVRLGWTSGGSIVSILNVNVLNWDGEKYTVKVYLQARRGITHQFVIFMKKDRNTNEYEVIGHKKLI